MKRKIYRHSCLAIALCILTSLIAAPLAVDTQAQTTPQPTKIVYRKNKYSPEDDVQIGRQVAAEAEQKLSILNDEEVTAYVERVGQRLVAAIPPEFQHREFHYYFKVVNDRSINAFALPGGPMFVNTGMIKAARNEGEMAGVMAHELSHVALRHGTAQATKAQSPSLLAGIGAIGGSILGGPLGSVVYAGSQIGAGAYLLHYSREYETEADLMGARIMARAGYDPHDLANMFKTIEAQSGSGGGGFFSDHPNPKDRYARINQEAMALQVSANPTKITPEFLSVQERLRGLPNNQSTQGGGRNSTGGNNYPSNPPSGNVEYPSSRYRSYSEFGNLRVNIPENWREVSDQKSVWFGPEGGYGNANGQTVYTHGVSFGTVQTRSGNLQQATDEWISNLEQGSGNLRARGGYQRTYIAGHNALWISMSNTNEANGRPEIITITTTQLRGGDLFYAITVSPESDYSAYQDAFRTILQSIQLND